MKDKLKYSSCLIIPAVIALLLLYGGGKRLFINDNVDNLANAIALEWYHYALQAEQETEGYRGPIAARTYAYAGLAAYEAALPALTEDYLSTAHHFPDLKLPQAAHEDEYYLPALLNGCYSKIFASFFPTAPKYMQDARRKIETKWNLVCNSKTDPLTYERSKAFGEQIAAAVFEWSVTDSVGHVAYLDPYDAGYVPPGGVGNWKPCPAFPQPALLPYWGNVRPFIVEKRDFPIKPLPTYSADPSSVYYSQALEVYTLNSPLSKENLWIAEFWSDDQPGLTFSPSGRWISIVSQVIEKEQPEIGKTLETYLKTGLALNDAIIACWLYKYHFNLERPETYITRVFDPEWRPVHHTPPFPAYPSGHATIGAAAAEVLTQLFGERYSLTDKSHEGRTEFKGTPRAYHSFYEMAFENAFSRIPLGVHFRMDCEEGMRLGFQVGKEISSLSLQRIQHFSSDKVKNNQQRQIVN